MNSVLVDKSVRFGVRMTKLKKYLCEEKKEFDLASQAVRCGTSIGANIAEANYAQSRPDFISKMHIALKEAAETEYWLKILKLSGYITDQLAVSLLDDCAELQKLLISTIKTAKK